MFDLILLTLHLSSLYKISISKIMYVNNMTLLYGTLEMILYKSKNIILKMNVFPLEKNQIN
jgi:hypothetical protein